MCTSICLLSLALSRNLLPQPSWVHWNNLSPWTVLCFFRDARSRKTFPQESSGQRNTLGCCWPDLPFGRLPTWPLGLFVSNPLPPRPILSVPWVPWCVPCICLSSLCLNLVVFFGWSPNLSSPSFPPSPEWKPDLPSSELKPLGTLLEWSFSPLRGLDWLFWLNP